jgi:hypothetical protein
MPERMDSLELWAHVQTLIWRLRWAYGLNAREREAVLDQLAACITELKQRGIQLELPFEDQATES